MNNRLKVMFLIGLFWIVFSTLLLLVGFTTSYVFIFTILGTIFFNLIVILLDSHNTKVNKWFNSKEFF